MTIHRYLKYFYIFLLLPFSLPAQDTLVLSRNQCEAIFLKENLLLIAEKLQISQAEARVLQAGKWPNPSLEIDEVNLWATDKQLAVFGDELQGLNDGGFGRNQQLAFSLEQFILTAGKRKKLIALEQVSVEKSENYFEELLRNLKIEFRNQLTWLQYLQMSIGNYQKQVNSIKQLTQSYQNQVLQGNIAKGEYIRLKAIELEIAKIINELNKEINGHQKEIKLLMRLPSAAYIQITAEGYLRNTEQVGTLSPESLIALAKKYRPDYKIARLDENYYNNLHAYEKAQRMPDITLKGGYDRGGNFMYNFIGFGLSMDLPVFDRNQGNIRSAQIGMEHSGLLSKQKELSLENETILAWQNLQNAIQFLSQIEHGYEDNLDKLLLSYTNSFLDRNISLLEYIDFMEAYLENKKIILEAGKEVNEKMEELNYTIGLDVLN